MDKKIGVYVCAGCSIGDAVDTEKLAELARKEFKVDGMVHPFLCSDEGMKQIRKDMADNGINALVIAACSPRAKMEVFSFDMGRTVVDRVNLREQVAWSHEAKSADGKTIDEDVQMLAEDQLRMGIVRVQHMDPPEPYSADYSKRILVIGGGVTGMTAAAEAAEAGYEVVLVEKESSLGGFAGRLFKEYPKEAPYHEPRLARP